ncbi:lipoprotein, partial [Mycoplasma capricolum subsp. capricolum]
MKKLLTLLGSVGLIASTSAAVVACGDKINY